MRVPFYRDGNDSAAMHSDKLHILTAPHPIAPVSLGEPRRMLIRAKTGTATRSLWIWNPAACYA